MHPIKFEGCNIELVKPENMTDEQCMSLPAFKGVDRNNFIFHLVAFKPNYEDMEALKRGEPIYVKILGDFPPIALFTLDEKGDINQ